MDIFLLPSVGVVRYLNQCQLILHKIVITYTSLQIPFGNASQLVGSFVPPLCTLGNALVPRGSIGSIHHANNNRTTRQP